MVIYIIISFVVIGFFSFGLSFSKAAEKELFFALGLMLVLIAGLRKPGMDYQSYLDIYNQYNVKTVEPAIRGISTVVKFIFNDPLVLFLIFAALGVSIKFVAIKQLTDLWFLAATIYVSYYFMYHEMIQIRAGVVSGILLLCIKPMYERKFWLFFVYCLVAVTFHISALVIIPLWFLNPGKLNKTAYLGVIALSYVFALAEINVTALVGLIPIQSVQDLYTSYLISTELGEQSDELNIFGALQILRIAICCFLIFYNERITVYNRYAPLLIKIYAISIALLIYLSDIPVIAFRISQLLGIVEVIALPLTIYVFSERSRRLAIFLPLATGAVMMCLMLFYRNLIE